MSLRKREIGVRLALGAQRGEIVRLLMTRSAGATAIGALAGAAAALALMRTMESLLYGVTAHDPQIFVAAPLMLFCVALAACAWPAWRATTLDPVEVLRDA